MNKTDKPHWTSQVAIAQPIFSPVTLTNIQHKFKPKGNSMAIPTTDLFEEFLMGSKLVSKKPEENYVNFLIGSQRESEAAVLYLSYPKSAISFDSIIQKLISELKANDHEASYEIALATLGIIVETRKSTTSAVKHANDCLSILHVAKLRHIVALGKGKFSGYELEFGEIKFGKLDTEKLAYWAKKYKCGYPECLSQYSGTFSIEYMPFDLKLIDWQEVPSLVLGYERWGEYVWINSVMDVYYHAVANVWNERMPFLFKDQLKIIEAGALVNFDILSFVNSPLASNISLFQWDRSSGKGGWALMSLRSIVHLNVAPKNLFLESFSWMETELGFTEFSNKPFDKAVASYCKFLQRAHDHRLKGNGDEAFLHFIIALDLVFGIKGQSTHAVCSRVSLLVHRQFEKGIDVQDKFIKRLYDSRSKYVHEGTHVKNDDIENAEVVCTEILWTLLSASGLGTFDDIDTYFKQIDYLVHAISAERHIDDDEYIKLGIPKEYGIRKPPNRVLN